MQNRGLILTALGGAAAIIVALSRRTASAGAVPADSVSGAVVSPSSAPLFDDSLFNFNFFSGEPDPFASDSVDSFSNTVTPDEHDYIPATGEEVAEVISASDRSTWPSGDRVWDVCQAIAIAEGYNVPNSNPANLHNPGDLSDGASVFGYEFHSGSRVTRFPSHEEGWKWLYEKIDHVRQNQSKVFSPEMSWIEFAMKYAGSWQPWVRNVTRELGVTPESKVKEYFA